MIDSDSLVAAARVMCAVCTVLSDRLWAVTVATADGEADHGGSRTATGSSSSISDAALARRRTESGTECDARGMEPSVFNHA